MEDSQRIQLVFVVFLLLSTLAWGEAKIPESLRADSAQIRLDGTFLSNAKARNKIHLELWVVEEPKKSLTFILYGHTTSPTGETHDFQQESKADILAPATHTSVEFAVLRLPHFPSITLEDVKITINASENVKHLQLDDVSIDLKSHEALFKVPDSDWLLTPHRLGITVAQKKSATTRLFKVALQPPPSHSAPAKMHWRRAFAQGFFGLQNPMGRVVSVGLGWNPRYSVSDRFSVEGQLGFFLLKIVPDIYPAFEINALGFYHWDPHFFVGGGAGVQTWVGTGTYPTLTARLGYQGARPFLGLPLKEYYLSFTQTFAYASTQFFALGTSFHF